MSKRSAFLSLSVLIFATSALSANYFYPGLFTVPNNPISIDPLPASQLAGVSEAGNTSSSEIEMVTIEPVSLPEQASTTLPIAVWK